MDSQNARETFERYLDSKGLRLAELDASQGIETMIAFYVEERPVGDDEDMDDLLFQWGVTGYADDGEWFVLDITRQFILGGISEDDNIWQLSLTFKYLPTEELREVESGANWCGTIAPRGVEYFQQWIQKSPGYQAVDGKQPDRVVLYWECAG